jgi:hypothetical protein
MDTLCDVMDRVKLLRIGLNGGLYECGNYPWGSLRAGNF